MKNIKITKVYNPEPEAIMAKYVVTVLAPLKNESYDGYDFSAMSTYTIIVEGSDVQTAVEENIKKHWYGINGDMWPHEIISVEQISVEQM